MFRTLKSKLAFCLNKEAEYERTLAEKDTQIEYLQKQLADLKVVENPLERYKTINQISKNGHFLLISR